MNILFINTLYDGGGAEKIARQLYQLLKSKENVRYIVGFNTKSVSDKNITIIYNGLLKRIFNRIITKNHSHDYISIGYSKFIINRVINLDKTELIHLHNAHGHYLGIADIAYLSQKAPLIWTIHDCWVMTGHCVSPFDCHELQRKCVNCPHLDYYTPIYNTKKVKRIYQKKSQEFRGKGIIFVAPSQWLKRQLQKGMLSGERIEVIYNGISLNEFQELNKNQIKKEWNISSNKKIIGIIAAQLGIKQKGMEVFLKALKYIENIEEYYFIIAGGGMNVKEMFEKGNINYLYLGYLDDENKLSRFYSGLDILVNPSLAETFGLVNVEAMACGTPVVAFDVGPMREIIHESVGWLAETTDAESLAKKICEAFSNEAELIRKSNNCREYVANNFSLNKMAEAYQKLYNAVITGQVR